MAAAVLAELAGADGVTVHLREDRRHIQDRDVRLLIETVRTVVNLELAGEPGMLAAALALGRPAIVTIVPERREEITTEGGLALDDADTGERTGRLLAALRDEGIRSSLFIDPHEHTVRAAVALEPDAIELHTGEYARAWKSRSREAVSQELARLRRAAALAASLGVGVHAGHGLTYENIGPIARLAAIEELNIGHSIVSRAVLVGMERAVAEMRACIDRARIGRVA